MGEHTKEPWKNIEDGFEVYGNLAQVIEGDSGELVTYGNLSKEDARRIVACVNACEGINDVEMDDLVNSGGVKKAIDNAYADRDLMKQQRDELLAALKDARASLDRANNSCEVIIDTIWHTPYETLFDFMDAAIEKAENP